MRGFSADFNAGVGDSNQGEPRRSANTHNYYTLWMDNAPEWSKFPKRSRSFICSESEDIADGFGKAFFVFPFDDANIGAAPADDLWHAFDAVSHLSWFMKVVHYGLHSLKRVDKSFEIPETYPDLVSALRRLTKEHISEMLATDPQNEYIRNLLNLLIETPGGKTYEDVFRRVLSTDGFELYTPQSYVYKDERELWIQGRAVFIAMLQNWNSEEGKIAEEFFNKHRVWM